MELVLYKNRPYCSVVSCGKILGIDCDSFMEYIC